MTFTIMKRLLSILSVAVILSSCSTIPNARLLNSASYSKGDGVKIISAVYADLDVSPEKITFFHIPHKSVINGGEQNAINTAVQEALLASNNADVLLSMESKVKYNDQGIIESIMVTGYPAKYTNFRNPSDDALSSIASSSSEKPAEVNKRGRLGK